ncbi:hypothetical protein Shyhy02_17740 [Streptomyces hygroscopicus subsp. hygroscopicus]|nr:hypothetical protein Shyhy02_17740 [Streptomyces hygroscopicus subsp. hygroscopicus]
MAAAYDMGGAARCGGATDGRPGAGAATSGWAGAARRGDRRGLGSRGRYERAIGATTASVSDARSLGDSSTSSPRRPAETQIVP